MSGVRLIAALILTGILLPGCQSLPTDLLSELTFGVGEEMREQEEKHRKQYQESRDPEARDWLLANAVVSGMTRGELTTILGEEGRRVYDSQRFTNNGGHYQIDDEVWKWGPDSKGHSVFLVFREDRLVNFDPNEFH